MEEDPLASDSQAQRGLERQMEQVKEAFAHHKELFQSVVDPADNECWVRVCLVKLSRKHVSLKGRFRHNKTFDAKSFAFFHQEIGTKRRYL